MSRVPRPHKSYAPRDAVLTDEEFEGLHTALDKTRSNSETVRVDKEALSHLLMDYGAFHRVFEKLDGQLHMPVAERTHQPETVVTTTKLAADDDESYV